MNRLTVLQNILAECEISASPEQLAEFLKKIDTNPITSVNPKALLAATRMIRSRRETLGISQVSIGSLIGVSDTTIRSYESNLYVKTSVGDVATILSYLEEQKSKKQREA